MRRKMLKFQLGDMRNANGEVLAYEVLEKSAKYAHRISENIAGTPVYEALYKMLPTEYLQFYFKYVIKEAIYKFVRQGAVIQWYKRNAVTMPETEKIVLLPASGIFPELERCWDIEGVPVKMVNPASFGALINPYCRIDLLKSARLCLRRRFTLPWAENKGSYATRERPREEKPIIACHYNEGIDMNKRNDLDWYAKDKIPPERILIYIDGLRPNSERPLEKDIIDRIEEQGFKWVAFRKEDVEGRSDFWHPHDLSGDSLIPGDMAQNKAEQWVLDTGNNLLREVNFWKSFYDEFNIVIDYTSAEAFVGLAARTIAFDTSSKNRGIFMGKQRSEMRPYTVCFNPKHVFFIWSKRTLENLTPEYEKINTFVISGYPNKIAKNRKDYCTRLKMKRAKFIVALFDNMHGPDSRLSTRNMARFYKAFFEWVLTDEEIGIIIKSKKSHVINSLSKDTQRLFETAIKTGRCIRVEDEFGRLPSDASYGVDMSVGIGMSTAVTEAVLGGSRGIHYDATNRKRYTFYRWGHEKLIFEDLEKMMDALKKYKNDRNSVSDLGDWSPHIGKLDPFRDDRGGERMGMYIRWLLEGFDKGETREGAVQNANRLYGEKWGKDKIVSMDSGTAGEGNA
ncbi:MAG: hypothetical protein JW994_04130 [Candidatus Omnitrophica bacterium]|nr:hypothetical protein [Candidatus Omnitrophota bacterium]